MRRNFLSNIRETSEKNFIAGALQPPNPSRQFPDVTFTQVSRALSLICIVSVTQDLFVAHDEIQRSLLPDKTPCDREVVDEPHGI